MTLGELLERIKHVATSLAKEPVDPKMLDNEVLIELILPRVFSIVAGDAAKDPAQLMALRRSHLIAFTDGVGDLPSEVKDEYATSIFFTGDPLASYIPQYSDYLLNDIATLTSNFTVQSGSIYYQPVNQTQDFFNGSAYINAVSLPILPISTGNVVDIKDNILDQVISVAASIANGTIPLATVALDYKDAK